MKISYQKHFSPDGTVYNQRIKITREEWQNLLVAFVAEIAQGLPRKNEYIQTSGNEIFMTVPKIWGDNFVYLNHTQTRFANLFLKLPLKNRNTYLKIN